MKAIRIHQHGGPDVLEYEDIPVPKPTAHEALIKIAAIGVNFIDIYNRTGFYKTSLPFTPGREATGVVEAVGAGVSEVGAGDRVAYAMELGAYAEYAVVSAAKLVPLPEKISFETGAAAMLQGMTAHYLTQSTYPLKADDTCLVHAAAGGVGLLLIQMAKRLGARVIGTVSTEAKARLAKEAGADEVILYTEQDFETEVKRLTSGRGVEVVYDSVGQTTYEKSLNCLAPRGYLVCFGQSSGPVPPIDPLVLSAKGSLFLTRATLAHYISTREELLQRAGEVFKWIEAGKLKLRIDRTLPLAEAATAHRLLESRQTAGKILLKP
ncbi:MAG: quinone oxidoreductase [candidate division KSB1 bacterium]|nr:quinone oxidoreductase [candidate division KSB1 bacterium]